MPPRTQLQTACQSCRRKRIKVCDSKIPCGKCVESDAVCEYDRSLHVSKDKLRAEIAQLKRALSVSQYLHTPQGASHRSPGCENPTQGSESRVGEGVDSGYGWSPSFRSLQTSSAETSTTSSKTPSGSSSFNQLLSWRHCRPRADPLGENSGQSTILSLPPLPYGVYTSQSRTDIWTHTGWTRAHIRHLFDVLFTWDYLPLCLLCKDAFLQDYHSGSDRFCSVALVYSILALATQIINEYSDEDGLLPSGWLGSKVFDERAQAVVQSSKRPLDLPDIQAIGILSLYHLRHGREVEAEELAKSCVTAITELCQHEPLTGGEDERYVRSRAATYCGAVSLTRMVSLATGRLFNIPNSTMQEDLLLPSQLSSRQSDADRLVLAADAADESEQRLNLQLIAAKLFQLTDFVHELITSVQVGRPVVSSDIVEAYNKCLDWYGNLSTLFDSNNIKTPFELFVHMYYHFCLLCAFRPFVNIELEHTQVLPAEICTQAAQSILALAQSYEDLFTLRRVSVLMPYFVCAAGLFCLAVEDSGSRIPPVHLRLNKDNPMSQAGPGMPDEDSRDGGQGFAAHIKMSVVAHACLLLSNMASTHPAARMADELLRQEIGVPLTGETQSATSQSVRSNS